MALVRAAVCHEFGAPLVIEEIALRAPLDGEVEVSIAAVAVCHSDILFAEGAWGGELPAVYGHEAAGRVTALGPGVQGVALGDRVIVTLIRACGHCSGCAQGRPTQCANPADRSDGPIRTAEGTALEHGMNTGAFAEKVVVHQSQIAKVPETMPFTSACLLACGVITGVGAAVNTTQVRPGEHVVVIGAGGVGLNAIQGARIAGAARIVAVDLVEEKLAAAREFGATDTILASDEAPWKTLYKTTGRLADVVLVTVGALPAYETALRYLTTGGRMAMVGLPHTGQTASYEPVVVAALGQSLRGSFMGDTVLARDIPWMVDLYGQGRLNLDELVSGQWRLDQINEAIADTKSGAARRNVIVFE